VLLEGGRERGGCFTTGSNAVEAEWLSLGRDEGVGKGKKSKTVGRAKGGVVQLMHRGENVT